MDDSTPRPCPGEHVEGEMTSIPAQIEQVSNPSPARVVRCLDLGLEAALAADPPGGGRAETCQLITLARQPPGLAYGPEQRPLLDGRGQQISPERAHGTRLHMRAYGTRSLARALLGPVFGGAIRTGSLIGWRGTGNVTAMVPSHPTASGLTPLT